MMPQRIVCLIALLVTPAAFTFQQPPTPTEPAMLLGQSTQTGKRILEADQQAKNQDWLAAINAYLRILDEVGDDLVSFDGKHSQAARWICHERLAGLPAEALTAYRARLEPQAKQWLDEGIAKRDPRPLRRIVAEAFCTRAGETALLLLGDMAFEQGSFALARQYWEWLVPPLQTSPNRARALHYPDPQVKVAEVHARQIMAALFAGDRQRAEQECERFGQQYPETRGYLAGRRDKLFAILKAAFRQVSTTGMPRRPSWSTFAGDPSRNPARQTDLPYYWPNVPSWTQTIPDVLENPHIQDSNLLDFKQPPLVPGPAELVFHPIVHRDQVLINDAQRILRFDRHNGAVTSCIDLKKLGKAPSVDLRLPSPVNICYTLSSYGEYVYARLGTQAMRANPTGRKDQPGWQVDDHASYLVCLGPDEHGLPENLKLHWWLPAMPSQKGPIRIWEGTPLLRGDCLLTARSRFEGDKVVTSIVCMVGLGRPFMPPELAWERDVCERKANPNAPVRYRHDLLTLAGDQVIYCSHSGVIVSLDARDGERIWAYRYPHRDGLPTERNPPASPRPCLVSGSQILAAPADAMGLLCLHAVTGRLLWHNDNLHVEQLLGTTETVAVCTTGGAVPGIWGVNLQTGSTTRSEHGWGHHLSGGTQSLGQGFVRGKVVFWPTRAGLYFLNADTGRPLRAPLHGIAGNLALSDGCLIAVQASQIQGFLTENEDLDIRQEGAQRRPNHPWSRYRLGLAQAEAGQIEAALASFGRCRTQADLATAALATQRAFDLINDTAEAALRRQHRPDARMWWQRILSMDPPFPRPWQVRALARLAEISEVGQQPAAWDRVRTNLTDSGMTLINSAGLPRRATRLVHEQQLGTEPTRLPGEELPVPEPEPLGLALPLQRVWETPVQERLVPLRPFVGNEIPGRVTPIRGGTFLLSRHNSVHSFDANTGERLFQIRLAFSPSHAERLMDGWVIAGSQGVARLQENGQIRWTWTTPTLDPLGDAPEWPARLAEPVNDRPRLSTFRLAGGWVLCRYDPDTLLALQSNTGEVGWQVQATGNSFGVQFTAAYAANKTWVLLQQSDGTLLTLKTADGKVYQRLAPDWNPGSPTEASAPTVPWAQPPIFINQDEVLFAPNRQSVVRYNLRQRRPVWIHTIAPVTSLFGSTSELRPVDNRFLLVRVSRNDADELRLLDVRTGRGKWSERIRDVGRLAEGDVLGESIILPVGSEVISVRFSNGQPSWRIVLPGASSEQRWRVRAVGGSLLLVPNRCGFSWQKQLRDWWSSAPTWYDASRISLHGLDAADGLSLQQLSWPNASMGTPVLVGGNYLVVLLPTRLLGFASDLTGLDAQSMP